MNCDCLYKTVAMHLNEKIVLCSAWPVFSVYLCSEYLLYVIGLIEGTLKMSLTIVMMTHMNKLNIQLFLCQLILTDKLHLIFFSFLIFKLFAFILHCFTSVHSLSSSLRFDLNLF